MNAVTVKKWLTLTCLIVIGAVGFFVTARHAGAAPDWMAVEQVLGKSGQLQPGGVFRIGFPRTDLTVTVQGIRVEALCAG